MVQGNLRGPLTGSLFKVFLVAAFWAVFSWPFVANAQTTPTLNYKVGDLAPFQGMCSPIGSGIVLSAFIEGGPELADTAFEEQAEKEECHAFGYMLWAKLVAINYIGFFHDYHLWALRFGERGFSIVYFGPYDQPSDQPGVNGHEHLNGVGPMEREA